MRKGQTGTQLFSDITTRKPAVTDTSSERKEVHSHLVPFPMMVSIIITYQSVDGDTFCKFTERNLLPQLLPFCGINARKVVVMDKLSST